MATGMADALVLPQRGVRWTGLGAPIRFVLGAACTVISLTHAKRHHRQGVFAMPLLIEASMLLAFGQWQQRRYPGGGLGATFTILVC